VPVDLSLGLTLTLALEPIARGAFTALEPLEGAFRDPVRLAEVLRELLEKGGVEVEFTLPDIATLTGPFVSLADRATAALDAGRTLLLRLDETDDALERVELIGRLLGVVRDLVSVARDVGPAVDGIDLTSLPAPLDVHATWDADVAARLPEYLVVSWLRQQQPVAYQILNFLGVVPDDAQEFRFDVVEALIADPVAVLKDRFGWGDPALVDRLTGLLLDKLAELIQASGLPARITAVDPAFDSFFNGQQVFQAVLPLADGFIPGGYGAFGVVAVPVPRTPTGSIDGILFSPLVRGTAGRSFLLDEAGHWRLDFHADLDGLGDLWVRIHPTEIKAGASAPDATAGATLVFGPPEGFVLLGSREGSRLELSGFETSLELVLDGDAPPDERGDVVFRARTAAVGNPGLRLVLTTGEADSFLGSVLGHAELEATADVEMSWSAQGGFSFGAGTSLSHRVDVAKQIGPVRFDAFSIAILPAGGPDDDGIALDVRTDLGARLGPFSLDVQGLGVTLSVVKPQGGDAMIGPFDVGAGLRAPNGIGFAIEAPSVSGGGFLEFDFDAGRYSGALQLQIMSVGLTAVGLLSLPPEGTQGTWSLLFALSLRFQIPLGFGFTLTGVGGLIAVNRTFDPDSLTRGVRTGAIGTLMFPPEPLNAPALVQQMESYFPEAQGNFIIGPFAQISWGVGKLITAELGILISIPTGSGSGVKIAIIGILRTVLPKPEAPLLVLNMAVLGLIDFQAGTIELAASVYDSTLLKTIQLSGDMALFAVVGRQSYFLLSVGGFHPAWKPPAGVPARITNLKRLRAAIKLGKNIECSIKGYFAVTSNTFQLGGRFDLVARAKFLGAEYRAEGYLSFDLLIYFNPFRFIADATAGFSVKKKKKEILGIHLAIHVRGPKPWYGRAEGRFKFFGIKVKFRVSFGKKPQQTTPGTFPVREEIVKQLADVRNWDAVGSGGVDSTWDLVILTEEPDDDSELLVRPDGRMEVRQRIAPLDQELEIYGTQNVEGPKRTRIAAAGFASGPDTPTEDVLDGFAPAQYRKMSESEKLAAPSFEDHLSGVSFGGQGVTIDAAAAEEKELTWEVYKAGSDVAEGTEQTTPVDDDRLFRLTADVAQLNALSLDTTAVALGATTYTVVDGDTGEIATDVVDDATVGMSWMQATHLLQTASTDAHDVLLVVPFHTAVNP